MFHNGFIGCIAFSISLFVLTLLECSTGYSQVPPPGVLKGTVLDTNDAVVPNAVVTLASRKRTVKATSSASGQYSFKIDPGIYSLTVDAPRLGFGTTYRSHIRISPGLTRTLDLRLYGKILVLDPNVVPSKEPTDHPPLLLVNFTFEEVPNMSPGEVGSGMVRFASKCESPSLSTYMPRFMDSDAGRYGVAFSYDLFTITADRLEINSRSKEIYAFGNIVIDDEGEHSKQTGAIKITIKDGKAIHETWNQNTGEPYNKQNVVYLGR
jgi:hypothetical protein